MEGGGMVGMKGGTENCEKGREASVRKGER